MDEMISREAAINALIRKRQPVNNGDGTITITMMTDEVIRDVLNELPSVQPQRMRGKWVKENIVLTSNPPQYQWHCSECGTTIHGYSAEILTDFCPNCGADMRGEQDE